MLRNTFFCAACGVAAILSGCGGLVVFDDGSNTGGAGANGPGPGSGPGAGPETTCQSFCAATAGCPTEGGDCQSACAALYVDGCIPETDAFLNCIVKSIGLNCELPPDACALEAIAWSECTTPQPSSSCQTESCSAGGVDCSCSGTCTSGNQISKAQVSCKGGFDSPPQCECFLDGAFLGSCTDFSEGQCTLEGSCCVDVFFGFGQPDGDAP